MKRFILLNHISYLINKQKTSGFFFLLGLKRLNQTLMYEKKYFNDIMNNAVKLSIHILKI